jgi:hypothetical protein
MRSIVLLLFVIVVAGCAGTAPVETYFPPQERLVSTVVLVDESLPEVWDHLLRRLPHNGFVIDKANRESGKIVAVLSTDAPDLYADCGAVAYGAGKKIPLARTTSRPGVTSKFSQAALLQSTVYITVEEDRDGTLVSVKPYYELFVDVRTGGYRVRERWVAAPKIVGPDGEEYGGEVTLKRTVVETKGPRRVRSLPFVTNSPNELNWGTERDPLYVTCCSTGKIETLILGMAGGKP